MQALATFKIPAATLQGLTNGQQYWVDNAGVTTVFTQPAPVNGLYQVNRNPVVKLYTAQGAMTGIVGGQIQVVEVWPNKNSAGLVNTYPPSLVGAGGAVFYINGPTIPAGAGSTITNILPNPGTFATGSGTVVNVIWEFGLLGIQIVATTWPTTATDLYFELWGLRYSSQPGVV